MAVKCRTETRIVFKKDKSQSCVRYSFMKATSAFNQNMTYCRHRQEMSL